MKWTITHEEKYSVELPFPQRVRGHIIDKRYGIIVSLTCGFKEAKVEISPFQGFLDTPLSQALDEFKWDVEKTNIPNLHDFQAYLDYFKELNLAPSSFFAFLQIIDQLLPAFHQEIKVNRLLSFDQFKDILPMQLESEGKVKIKIYRETPEEVVAALSKYNPDLFECFFRLDMNGTWKKEMLLALWAQLQNNERHTLIDYFEEPLDSYEQYVDVTENLPIMHEECIKDYLKEPDQALGLVYKPSQMPWPNKLPPRLVISSCWEGPYGLGALKRIAALYPKEFHGLGATIEYK